MTLYFGNLVIGAFDTTYSSNARQKRKLDEMYDQLRSEYESMKRSAIQPAGTFYTRNESDLFANDANMMDNRDTTRKGNQSFVLFSCRRQRKCFLLSPEISFLYFHVSLLWLEYMVSQGHHETRLSLITVFC